MLSLYLIVIATVFLILTVLVTGIYIMTKRYIRATLWGLQGLIFIILSGWLGNGISSLVTLKLPEEYVDLFVKANRPQAAMTYGVVALLIVLVGMIVMFNAVRNAYKMNSEDKKRSQAGLSRLSLKEEWGFISTTVFKNVMTIPGYILFAFFVVVPIVVTILIAFTNLKAQVITSGKEAWSLQTIQDFFSNPYWYGAFGDIVLWTILWTLGATIVPIVIGLLLAITINQKDFKGKKIFRPILLLPWAVPAFFTLLIWKSMLQPNGTFNVFFLEGILHLPIRDESGAVLQAFNIQANPWYARFALIMVQGWLGFAYVFITTTGVLQSISADLYEAARIDGASRFQQFNKITKPLLLIATLPVLVGQFVFNFNNFGAIWLLTQGGPAVANSSAGSTDILISYVFKLVFNDPKTSNFAMASWIVLIMSIILISISAFVLLRNRSFSKESGI